MNALSAALPRAVDTPPPVIEEGMFTLYLFYDIGDEIDLEAAQACLAAPTVRRQPPIYVRQSERIEIAQLPVWVELDRFSVELGGIQFDGMLHASIYDLGAVALVLELPLPHAIGWDVAADLFAAVQPPLETLEQRVLAALGELEALIRPAIVRPARSTLVEDYSVLLVTRLAAPESAAVLAGHPVVQAALLGERRPLVASAADLTTAMSYFPDDLVLLSWNGALIIESDPLAAMTIANLIEFANIELLLMRYYDALLDGEVSRMYRRVATPPRRFALPLVRTYTRLLREVQRLITEVTEVTERVDNAFKVTDDVYWNRLYSATLNVLRVHVWRAGVEHRLALLRETYSMLHHEADAERGAALEWAIVLLIVFEIIMAFAGLF